MFDEAGSVKGPASPTVLHTEQLGPFSIEVLAGVRPPGAQRAAWIWSVFLTTAAGRRVIEHGTVLSDAVGDPLQACKDRALTAARNAQIAAQRITRPQPDRRLF